MNKILVKPWKVFFLFFWLCSPKIYKTIKMLRYSLVYHWQNTILKWNFLFTVSWIQFIFLEYWTLNLMADSEGQRTKSKLPVYGLLRDIPKVPVQKNKRSWLYLCNKILASTACPNVHYIFQRNGSSVRMASTAVFLPNEGSFQSKTRTCLY